MKTSHDVTHPVYGEAIAVDFARRAAQIDHARGITVAAGLDTLRAAGATDSEITSYTSARAFCALLQAAAESGIAIITFDGGVRETGH